MNNPDSGSNFLSPLRTQPVKKQRGGVTPDIVNRSRQPLSSGGTTAVAGAASAASVNETAQESIARRRAELRRLQALREARSTDTTKRPEVTPVQPPPRPLLNGKDGGGGPPPPPPPQGPPRGSTNPIITTTTTSTDAVVGELPKRPVSVARHHSDIFPDVHKSPARERKAIPDLARPSPPLPTLAMEVKTTERPVVPPVGLPPPGPPPPGPPPSAMNGTRNKNNTSTSRAKSAPPVRPPLLPPQAGTTLASITPPTSPVQKTATSNGGAKTNSRPPPSARPVPLSPASLSLQPTGSNESANPLTTPVLSSPKWSEQAGKIVRLSPAPPKPLPPKVNDTKNNKSPSVPPTLPTTTQTPSHGPPPQAAVTPARTTTAIEDDKTPMPVETPFSPTLSSSRRERISEMRAGLSTTTDTRAADSNGGNVSAPSSPLRHQSATAALLEQTLKETMEDKKMALQQIKLLEEELLKARRIEQQLQPTHSTIQPKTLQKMLQLATSDGEAAAWKWAKAQVAGVPPMSSMESPLRPGKGSLSSPIAGTASSDLLKPAPQPKLNRQQHPDDLQRPPNMVAMERQLIQHFREAAEYVTWEYESDLAHFHIRRPYGFEPVPTGLWASVSDGLIDHAYSKKAHVSTVSTLQVAGTVKTSGSLFLLSGVCELKYQANSNDEEASQGKDSRQKWSYISPDRSSSSFNVVITFIDNEGVERDWSPRLILEEALNVRDQYCRAITSTALGFKDRPVQVISVPEISEAKKPTMSEIAVDTSDIPPDPTKSVAPIKDPPPPTISPPAPTEQQKPKQQPQEDESGSGDVLAVFLGMVFKSILNLIYWLLIGLPLSIIRGSIVSVVVIAVLSMAYLHLLEHHHNGQVFSMSGTTSGYHSNTVQGIL